MDSSTLQSLLQSGTVALLVSGCSAYAVWSLMPAVMRRSAAAKLLRLPLPVALAARLRKHAEAVSGCGCNGCDRAGKRPAASTTKVSTTATTAAITTHPITFHRQPRR